MKYLLNDIGSRLGKNVFLYYFLNLTWGLLLTVIGYLVLIFLLPFGKVKRLGHVLYLDIRVRERDPNEWGFSLGTVMFIHSSYQHGRNFSKLLTHEYGHTVQNAIFGPFMIFFVSLPSLIRYWYRHYLYLNDKEIKTEYDSVWFEGTASYIGFEAFLKK